MQISKVLNSYANMPKEIKYLIYASIMPSVAYGLIFTNISYLLTVVQGVSADFAGIVISSMGISTFVASIFIGIAVDIYGRKKVLVAGNILASIILVVIAMTTNPILLILTAVLEGISEAAVLASSSALLADKAKNKKKNKCIFLVWICSKHCFWLGKFCNTLCYNL